MSGKDSNISYRTTAYSTFKVKCPTCGFADKHFTKKSFFGTKGQSVTCGDCGFKFTAGN